MNKTKLQITANEVRKGIITGVHAAKAKRHVSSVNTILVLFFIAISI